MNAALKKIDVVVLFVSDLDRATAFYRDTLGMGLQFQDDASAAFDLQGTMLLLLTTAGAQDLLSTGAVAVPHPAGASSQLVAFVDDVDATYTELAGQGVEFIREPIDREWGMRTAHFKDPDGNIWEIAKPLVKASDAR